MASPRELWREHVQRWKDGGLTARQYAAETGINVHTLTTWSSRLRREAGTTVAPRNGRSLAPRFVEVAAEGVTAADGRAAVLEIVVGDATVRVPVGFDEATLARLLAVVRRA